MSFFLDSELIQTHSGDETLELGNYVSAAQVEHSSCYLTSKGQSDLVLPLRVERLGTRHCYILEDLVCSAL